MGLVFDKLESVMSEVSENRESMLNEDYIVNIISDLQKTINPFNEYLSFNFEEKTCNSIGSSTNFNDKVISFNQLRAESFYPTRIENHQTKEFASLLVILLEVQQISMTN